VSHRVQNDSIQKLSEEVTSSVVWEVQKMKHSSIILDCRLDMRPPLWSSGQSSWLQIQRSRVRFPALPDFLRSSGSGTGSTQTHEDN
jgi:hypothetical protein